MLSVLAKRDISPAFTGTEKTVDGALSRDPGEEQVRWKFDSVAQIVR